MNKVKIISLTASMVFAMVFTFSCSDDGGGEEKYSYCIKDEFCHEGPYTLDACSSFGGMPSNNCPNSSGGESSSSVGGQGGVSSSSVEGGQGSSSSSSAGGQGGGSSSSVGGGQSSSSSSSVGGQGGVSSSSVGGGQSSSSSSSVGGQSGVSSSSVGGGQSSSSSSSVGGQSGVIYGSPVTYEGETYQTVVIGTQTWMSKNLNYAVAGSKCYGEGGKVFVSGGVGGLFITKTLSPAEVQANCTKYGRLYDWSTVMALPSSCNEISCSSQIQSKHRGICPSGWHIPSNDDWDVLMDYVGGYTAGKHLKAQNGWEPFSGVENLDTWGFSALPGGDGDSGGSFYLVGDYGYWWSASESEGSSDDAYLRRMSYNGDYAYWVSYGKSSLRSVRCLQD